MKLKNIEKVSAIPGEVIQVGWRQKGVAAMNFGIEQTSGQKLRITWKITEKCKELR